jgi:DNA-binding MarR family transcriptional regulator
MASEQLRIDDQLCFAIYAAMNALTRSYKPKLASLGITYPQYILLMVLWQDGPRTISKIAQRLKLPPNGITPVIDRLEKAGLLVRRRNPDDRRTISIHLTAEGVALEEHAARAQFSVVCETQLGAEALGELREELHALVRRMENSGPVLEEI